MTALEKLFKVVTEIESGGNAYAIRFERHYVERIKDNDKALLRAREHLHAYTYSLKAYLSFSVGRLQFMTYNFYFIDVLYEYLKANNLLPVTIPFLIGEKHEKTLFELFLKERAIGFYLKLKANSLSEGDFKSFGRIWNGKEEYGQRVFERFKGA